MKMPWKNVVCICAVFLIFALGLGYFLNSISGTYVEGTVDTEDLIIIDAKVEKISFYENYIWMNIEYMGKTCGMYCRDTEFKNHDEVPINPKEMKEGQKIKACVNEVVTYEPIITFNCYTVWLWEEELE